MGTVSAAMARAYFNMRSPHGMEAAIHAKLTECTNPLIRRRRRLSARRSSGRREARLDMAAGIIIFACAMIATIKPGEHLADPNAGERIEILTSRPIHTTIRDRFMLIDP
jgi:hypothetical protein